MHAKERKQPTRKSLKPSKADPIEREYRRLALAVGDVTGFRLYVATYNDPRLRDSLIERLQVEQVSQNICITRLDLTGCDRESSLARQLREHVERTRPESGWRQAIMVTGLEDLLDYGREADMRFLETANLQRDVLPTSAPVAVVLWLSPLAAAAFPRAAPDLWHWRGAGFDFTGSAGERVQLLRDLVTMPYEREIGLSGDKRRERAAILEELLAELDKSGSPKSPRETAERADLLGQLGRIYGEFGSAREALPLFERQLALAREIGDRRAESYALGNLGVAWADLGEPRRAIEVCDQALKIAREIGDRRGEGAALSNLGATYGDLGEPRRAIEHFKQLLTIAREVGDLQLEGYALGNLGIAYRQLDEPQRAIEHSEQHLSIARAIGDRRIEGMALSNLGSAYANLGEVRRAIEYHGQALSIARAIGDRRGEGNALGNLGNAYKNLGEPRRAIEHYEQALPIAREAGDRQGEGYALFNSALALDALGDRGEAIERTKDALVTFEEIGAKHLAEKARAQLAEWKGEGGR